MTSTLCPPIPDAYTTAYNHSTFFNEEQLVDLIRREKREQPNVSDPKKSCETNLFFGFFFDGTSNNYELANQTNGHSNVARLYDIYPGRGVPGVLDNVKWTNRPDRYSHFYKVYTPGVGSPFKEVKDTGEGWHATLGGAFGAKGGDRIVWALIQAINNINRYFHQRPLVEPAEATQLATRILLSRDARYVMTRKTVPTRNRRNWYIVDARIEFENLLKRLHASVSQHWTNNGVPPAKIDPGIVQTIHMSIFGFSRGATQARAFTNWLDSLCRLDAMIRGQGTSSLGGFPVTFDFLGIFDTVASVGFGNTLGNVLLLSGVDGHCAWADPEDSLRIPACVNSCVHLVAGHELRRSFPCDSISVGFNLPERAREIVFPGVHSDVGGGYVPTEQGKGQHATGADMLSRIPLLYMYKQARLAGVPLKLELVAKTAQDKFAVDPATVKSFNAYISKCKKTTGALTDIIREQAILQMEWRYSRREDGSQPMHRIPSFVRAANWDKNDLESANREFNDELQDFRKSVIERGQKKAQRQPAGFRNSVDGEWEEIATYWPFKQPDPVVAHFFDEYVHDSRSGFKPFGETSKADIIKQLQEWSRDLRARKMRHRSQSYRHAIKMPGPPDYGMSTNMRMAAEKYDETGTIPRYINDGREPYALAEAGYFRFRKIYGGSDTVLLSNWRPAGYENEGVLAGIDKPRPQDTDHLSQESV